MTATSAAKSLAVFKMWSSVTLKSPTTTWPTLPLSVHAMAVEVKTCSKAKTLNRNLSEALPGILWSLPPSMKWTLLITKVPDLTATLGPCVEARAGAARLRRREVIEGPHGSNASLRGKVKVSDIEPILDILNLKGVFANNTHDTLLSFITFV